MGGKERKRMEMENGMEEGREGGMRNGYERRREKEVGEFKRGVRRKIVD